MTYRAAPLKPLYVLLGLGLVLYFMNLAGIAPTSIPILGDLASWLKDGTSLLLYAAVCIGAYAISRLISIIIESVESELRQDNRHYKDLGPLNPERDAKALQEQGREPRTLGELAAKQRAEELGRDEEKEAK